MGTNTDMIDGSRFGSMKVVGIKMGKSSKENRDGEITHFLKLKMKDAEVPMSEPKEITVFEENFEDGVFDMIRPYAKPVTERGETYGKVNLLQLRKAVESGEDENLDQMLIEDLFFKPWIGACVMPYVFAKGESYAYDPKTNKRQKNDDGKFRTAKSVDVLCIIKYVIPDPDNPNLPKYVYARGFDKDKQGQRLERTFFPEPVEKVAAAATTATTTASTATTNEPEVTEAEVVDENPF